MSCPAPRLEVLASLLVASAGCCLGCKGREAPPGTPLTIELSRSVPGDSVDIVFPWLARRDESNRTIWLNRGTSGLPVLLSEDGSVLGALGRIGQGPGELTEARAVFQKADSLVVSDAGSGTLRLYGPALQYVRDIPLGVRGASQLLFMRGDSLLLPFPLHSPTTFGLPFHVVDPIGVLVRSFGTTDRSVTREFSSRGRRVVLAETDSTFWAARYDTLQFQRWHMDGRLLSSLEPAIPWLVHRDHDEMAWNVERPATTIIDFRLRGEASIVALIQRPRADWQPTAFPATSRTESEASAALPLGRYLDYVEQVVVEIDAVTGRVVADAVLRGFIGIGFFAENLLYGLIVTEDELLLPTTAHIHR